MAGSTKLNKDGLNKVWLKVMELVQSLTGNVNRTKGTLQEQIDKLDGNLTANYPLKTQISNPNLLDNPWFTVNQRGQSEYVVTTYTVDRWFYVWNNDESVKLSVSDNGISMPNATSDKFGIIWQTLSNKNVEPDFVNKVVTVSVLLGNGDIISGTNIWKSIGNSTTFIDNSSLYVYEDATEGGALSTPRLCIRFSNSDTIIKAIKLELGSMSTLAMDTAPNYELELAKCSMSTVDPADTYANKPNYAELCGNLTKYAISDIGSMIFVGDSMMAGVGATLNTGLGYQLANAFGKTVGTDAFIMAQSGCGFVTESSSYPSFETIMKNNASAVSDKNKVTAIVIIGGTNDVLRVKSYADLKTSFQSLCNYIKNTYKNARIYFAPNIMCDGTDTISDYLKGYLNVFGNDFLLNKITYIGNLGSYMRKMYLIGKQEGNTYFNDTVHPNANGYKLMAHFVKSLIIDGGNDISVSIYNTISNYDGCIEIIGERINLRAFSIAIYDSTRFDFVDASAGISLNGIYIGKSKFKLPLGSTSVSTAPYISKQNYGYINVNNTFYPCMFNCMLNKDGTISVFCVCIANSTFVTATSITAIWVALEVEGNINYTNIIL